MTRTKDWWAEVVADYGFTRAHLAAKENTLPSDFSQWDIAKENGWTVAHEAAGY